MDILPNSITITIAVLTVFLCTVTALKYGVANNFLRTRITMTCFFFFIIATLTISFWQYTAATLPFTVPAGLLGIVLGYAVGARAAEDRLKTEGIKHYMEHFAHIHIKGFKSITWWTFINFYSVMSALVLINLVGLSTVIFREVEAWSIGTSTLGAFLIGSIIPYLVHLWSISSKTEHKK